MTTEIGFRTVPLELGDRFVTRTGPKRLIWPGTEHFFQKGNRRYWCRVLTSENELYLHCWRGYVPRCKCEVEVIAR